MESEHRTEHQDSTTYRPLLNTLGWQPHSLPHLPNKESLTECLCPVQEPVNPDILRDLVKVSTLLEWIVETV